MEVTPPNSPVASTSTSPAVDNVPASPTVDRAGLMTAILICNEEPEVPPPFKPIYELTEGEYEMCHLGKGITPTGFVWFFAEIKDLVGNRFRMFLPRKYRSLGTVFQGQISPPLKCFISVDVPTETGSLTILE
jgi:hypothetical protein